MRFKTIGERVRYARKEAGMSVKALANASGLAATTIYDLERGDSKGTTRLPAVAQALGFSALWLESETGPERVASAQEPQPLYGDNIKPPSAPLRTYPVVAWAAAGQWEEVIDSYEPGDAEHWYPIPPHIRCSPSSFWTQVQGNSMNSNTGGKSYPHGSYIFIDPEARDLINGNLVLARLDDSHEATFKRLNLENGRIYLEPLNTQYDVIEIRSDSQVIGTMLLAMVMA